MIVFPIVPRFLFNKPLTSSPGLGPVHGGGQPELDGPLGKLGLQTPAEWTALLNASHNKEERDLTQLALSDPEQRELYEAARQVQNTFRKYKVGQGFTQVPGSPMQVIGGVLPVFVMVRFQRS